MQLKTASAFLIFCGSYLPLSVILLIKDFDQEAINDPVCWQFYRKEVSCYLPFDNPISSLGVVCFCLTCLALSLFLLKSIRCKNEVKVLEVKHVPVDLMNYVLPYIVAFITIDYSNGQDLIGYGFFLVWIFWITYKSGRAILNPMMTVFGWRLYEVSYTVYEEGAVKTGVMLSNSDLAPVEYVRHNKIQDVMIARREHGG
ncbi:MULTISPECIES: hypothetical protein [Halomonadaceae]|uniref:hypothetical protein n=1 Tax=Halomonadaceae TaxID=28256 RepID=UPI001599B3A0|nr:MULTISPECIES: hypothetical protein [Halomonas]QJQ96271.1 hypothetical protein HIO72_14015 [Halomonas sp. PA5]